MGGVDSVDKTQQEDKHVATKITMSLRRSPRLAAKTGATGPITMIPSPDATAEIIAKAKKAEAERTEAWRRIALCEEVLYAENCQKAYDALSIGERRKDGRHRANVIEAGTQLRERLAVTDMSDRIEILQLLTTIVENAKHIIGAPYLATLERHIEPLKSSRLTRYICIAIDLDVSVYMMKLWRPRWP